MNEETDLGEFMHELSELSRRYNLAIEGGVVYIMEKSDYFFDYAIDERSNLIRV